jgi:hypothetical protein
MTLALQQAQAKLVTHLREMGVPYMIAGAVALAEHGLPRDTKDIDIIIERNDLARLHAGLLVHDYCRRDDPHCDGLRDTTHNVCIDVMCAGDFPGDGQPRAIAFPHPAEVAEMRASGAYLPLRALVELKLAAGLSAAHRTRDLDDVRALIAAGLIGHDIDVHPSVRQAYQTMWQDVHSHR